MASPFKSIEELIRTALQAHLDPSKIDVLLQDQASIKSALQMLIDGQVDAARVLQMLIDGQVDAARVAAVSAQDLLAIKAFLGVPDPRIVATQEDVNKLGSLLKKQTDVVNDFDRTIPAEETAANSTKKE